VSRNWWDTVGCCAIRAPCGDQGRVGRSANGPTTRFLMPTLRWPLSQPAIHPRRSRHLPKSGPFRRFVVAIPPRNNRLGATHSVDVRGGATPPCGRKRRSKPGRRLSPARTSLPARSRFAVGQWTCATAWSRPEPEERQPKLRTVTALAPTRDRTGVLGRVKAARAARAAATIACRDLDAASARPRDGNCPSEPECPM
jgi:hypothetical protein